MASRGRPSKAELKGKADLKINLILFYDLLVLNNLFQNSILISAQQMALLGFLPTTLCRSMIRSHISRVALEWNL